MVRTNTIRVLFSMISSLAVASICSGADKIKRVEVLNFECSGEVESSTYVDSTQTCAAGETFCCISLALPSSKHVRKEHLSTVAWHTIG